MKVLSRANIDKTIYYLQRNGLRNTWYAVRERIAEKRHPYEEENYPYTEASPTKLEEQRKHVLSNTTYFRDISFSILVPAYRTQPGFLTELIQSVQAQSYPYWELILADASGDDTVWETAAKWARGIEEKSGDGAIRYLRLKENGGISENTQAALEYAGNSYVALLDHDDLLTADALFEMADCIAQSRACGTVLQMLYSDEDKCDGEGKNFFEPHRKEKFNYDLILSNNYICHFMAVKRELIQELGFRKAYDGAQDYDLVLRIVSALGIPGNPSNEKYIGHVAKVLYHWRCHQASTAENPRSKEYAYEAGRRALEAHLTENGVKARAQNLKHVGFYMPVYEETIWQARPDIGAVGGPVYRHGRLIGGRMSETGSVYYEGLPRHFSGYMHRASLPQDCEALDLREIMVRPELIGEFEKITGIPYGDRRNLSQGQDCKEQSLALGRFMREKRYRMLWRPEND